VKIAVLADTHDRAPTGLWAALAGAHEIWHLGDITTPAIIETLRTLCPKVRVVRGNCDPLDSWPETLTFTLAGHRIHLEHIPPARPPAGIDLLLHGHTHVPRDEIVHGTRYLNPGCITRPNRGAPASFAWLTLERATPVTWELITTAHLGPPQRF
jgi:hypothetical protein